MLYYSHINEDNLVEHQCLHEGLYESLFCIAGSAERLIALLDKPTLKNVFVIDLNSDALYLSELKIKALQFFSVEEYLKFGGVQDVPAYERLKMFDRIAPNLSDDCLHFWRENQAAIKAGILHTGHFERFLKKIRPLLMLWLGKSFYRQFKESQPELPRFTALKWQILTYLFSRREAYLLWGLRDPAFTGPGSSLAVIPSAINHTITEKRFHTSFMNHLIFHGDLKSMKKEELPLSISAEFLLKVKENLPRLKLHYIHGNMLDALKSIEKRHFTNAFFSLSDLLSFESYDYVEQILAWINTNCLSSCRIILRAFVRNRLNKEAIKKYLSIYGSVTDLSEFERTRMYQVFKIDC